MWKGNKYLNEAAIYQYDKKILLYVEWLTVRQIVFSLWELLNNGTISHLYNMLCVY